MGVFLSALMVSGFLALLLGLVYWFLFLRFIKNIFLRIILVLFMMQVSCIVMVIPVLKFLWNTTISKGEHVSFTEYRGLGPCIPESAKDISYYSEYSGCDAVFSIAESEIIKWTERNEWSCKEIIGKKSVQQYRLKIDKTVRNGIAIEKIFHRRGTGVRVVYDRDSGLAYYQFSAY